MSRKDNNRSRSIDISSLSLSPAQWSLGREMSLPPDTFIDQKRIELTTEQEFLEQHFSTLDKSLGYNFVSYDYYLICSLATDVERSDDNTDYHRESTHTGAGR